MSDISSAPHSSTRALPCFIYACYLAGFVTGFSPLLGLILAYFYRDAAPEWLRSHYDYAIRTFWLGFAWLAVGLVLMLVAVGLLVWLLLPVWFMVRCVKGLSYLDRSEAIPDPKTWLV